MKSELSLDQIESIFKDENLGTLIRSSIRDISRSDLLKESLRDLSEDALSTLCDEVTQVFTENAPFVEEYVAQQDKGPYPIAIRGIEGAYFVVASEYPNSETFNSLSDAEKYVEENYGPFLIK